MNYKLELEMLQNLDSRGRICYISILKKQDEFWVSCGNSIILNEELQVLSARGTFTPFTDLTEDTLIFDIEPHQIANFHKFILEAMKWQEYWTEFCQNYFITEFFI